MATVSPAVYVSSVVSFLRISGLVLVASDTSGFEDGLFFILNSALTEIDLLDKSDDSPAEVADEQDEAGGNLVGVDEVFVTITEVGCCKAARGV